MELSRRLHAVNLAEGEDNLDRGWWARGDSNPGSPPRKGGIIAARPRAHMLCGVY